MTNLLNVSNRLASSAHYLPRKIVFGIFKTMMKNKIQKSPIIFQHLNKSLGI